MSSAQDSAKLLEAIKQEPIKQEAILKAFDGRIDLGKLHNYADQKIPAYITKRNQLDNPVTNAGATLGRVLFYDTMLSIDGSKSCASCHVQAQAFGTMDILSQGVETGETARHSMRLVNTLYADEGRFFWDKRAKDLKTQVIMPLADHNEHGFSGVDGRPGMSELLDKVKTKHYYQELFAFAFSEAEAAITEENMASALAQFVNSIQSFDSKFDEGRAPNGLNIGDFDNFSPEENLGKQLFMDDVSSGGAGCNNCHSAPEFDIASNSDHNGVVTSATSKELDVTNTRSPSLRDLVAPDGQSNGPFMHDGSQSSLMDVIDHYNEIPGPRPEQIAQFYQSMDPRLMTNGEAQKLNLSDKEKLALVAFLKTLTGSNIYTDEKWSDPFIGN